MSGLPHVQNGVLAQLPTQCCGATWRQAEDEHAGLGAPGSGISDPFRDKVAEACFAQSNAQAPDSSDVGAWLPCSAVGIDSGDEGCVAAIAPGKRRRRLADP